MITDRHDAYRLLERLEAPRHLIRHLQLVGEVADELMRAYRTLRIPFDAKRIELGAAVHDAGKIGHPEELHAPGSLHEAAGERLLLAQGVQPEVARCCVTHAAWRRHDVSFEERSVALADKLWKGKREADLELLVIDGAASLLRRDRWDLFTELDAVFEAIAAGGTERLRRSVSD